MTDVDDSEAPATNGHAEASPDLAEEASAVAVEVDPVTQLVVAYTELNATLDAFYASNRPGSTRLSVDDSRAALHAESAVEPLERALTGSPKYKVAAALQSSETVVALLPLSRLLPDGTADEPLRALADGLAALLAAPSRDAEDKAQQRQKIRHQATRAPVASGDNAAIAGPATLFLAAVLVWVRTGLLALPSTSAGNGRRGTSVSAKRAYDAAKAQLNATIAQWMVAIDDE